jgi:uncharacterized repeat protein (TIGR01451 family)
MKRIALILPLLLLLLSLGLPFQAQDSSSSPIEFTGTVDSINGTSLVVTGLTVDASSIDPTILSQVTLGMTVTVSGTLQNGVVTASSIILPEAAASTATPVLTQPAPEPNVVVAANYTIAFNGSNFDGTQTSFSYTVTGTGVPTALSHFDIEIPNCPIALEVLAYVPADAVEFGVDPTTGVNGIKWDLPLGESESRTYTISFEGFVAEGTVIAAVKNGDGFFTVSVPGPSCAQPSVDVEKYVSADGGASWADADEAPGIEAPVGGQVSYRIVVTNTGNVLLEGLILTDSVYDASACTVPASLAPDASFECLLGPFAANVAQLNNVATINANSAAETLSDADNANYFTGALPAIDVEKYVSVGNATSWIDADAAPGADVEAGAQVYFRFVVRNSGNVPLNNVTLSDNLLNLGSCNIPATLEPNATAECVVGPMASTANQHTNVATARGDANGTAVEDSDAANYFGRTAPVVSGCFTIVFSGSVYANGQTTFTYGVIGNGCSPDLSHFDIEIPHCPVPLRVMAYSPTEAVDFGVDPTTHIDGIKWGQPLLSTASRTYSITFEGNVAIGSVTAAVKDGNGFHPVTVPGPACDVAQISVEKYVSADGGATWHDADTATGLDVALTQQVSYRFLVRNDGNSPLTGISLSDNVLNLSACTIPASLAATAFFECIVGPFPAQQGQHSNIATARGTFGDGSGQTVDTDSAYYWGGDRPQLDVQGYVSSNGGASWNDADGAPGLLVNIGSTVHFRYVVTNTGTAALSGISLTGTLGSTAACSIPATLEAGASFECLAGTATAVAGQQSDPVSVSATGAGQTLSDSDNTRFFGGDVNQDLVIGDGVIIVIDGPVEAIDGNVIIIFGQEIILDPDDPRLGVIQIGDIIRIEGVDDSTILIAIIFVFTDVEVFINADGIVWRDDGSCGNPPPPWAPAWGWRGRCEGSTVIIIGGGTLPPGCKYTGFGNGNIRIKCSRSSGGGSRRS